MTAAAPSLYIDAVKKLLPLVLVLFASQLFGELAPALVADIRKKAEAGDAASQSLLGYWYASDQYDTGRGVLEDHKEAVKWYRKAAEQGYALAQVKLGGMYGSGRGVPQDHKEAIKWCRKAAMQGNARAQVALGASYAKGGGVLKDYVAAYAWYSLAAGYPRSWRPDKEGRPESGASGLAGKHLLPSLAKEMTSEQIAEAKELSKELLKKIEANKKADKNSSIPLTTP